MDEASNHRLLDWARARAKTLRANAGSDVIGTEPASQVMPTVARELEFLRMHAKNTVFVAAAEAIFVKVNVNRFYALTSVAALLESWVEHVEDGFLAAVPVEVRIRTVAASDLVEQAQTLLDDGGIHPAAPVMLAGAALEEFLRGMFSNASDSSNSLHGLAQYAGELKKLGVIDVQEVKDITAWAGQRNAAAHGQFDKLSVERAQLMLDGVNLFMRQFNPVPSPSS